MYRDLLINEIISSIKPILKFATDFRFENITNCHMEISLITTPVVINHCTVVVGYGIPTCVFFVHH